MSDVSLTNEPILISASWSNGTLLGYCQLPNSLAVTNLLSTNSGITLIKNTTNTAFGISNLNSGTLTLVNLNRIGVTTIGNNYTLNANGDSGLIVAVWTGGSALAYYEWTPNVSSIGVQTLTLGEQFSLSGQTITIKQMQNIKMIIKFR